ncbi:class F sortase [Streptomyces sp. NPDC013187]|uniref:class F sortase n=1 Tax=Streptomyces sp. NPDC013187 TaxID=3364865 RepID=UPI0036A45D35
MAVSLLVVAGFCWDRGEEPGATTVTALPPDFTTAAHPGSGTAGQPSGTGPGTGPGEGPGTSDHPVGAGTGKAALPGTSPSDMAASPGTSGTGETALPGTSPMDKTALPGTSGSGKTAVPGAPGAAAAPAGPAPANPSPRLRTGPAEAPASATTPARTPGSRTPGATHPGARAPGPTHPGARAPGPTRPGARAPGPATPEVRAQGAGAPGARGAKPAAPASRPAAAIPRPAPKPAAPAVRKPRPPAGLRPLPRSRATRLLIPYLDVDAPVMDLGLDRDRRLTAPPDDDPKLVGWYRHGASPGEQGTAVAVGHLDTDRGPAVFAGLTELKRGRIIKARRADGRIALYTVDKIKSYEKARFPSQEVYGARGRPELRLITCGGTYDRRKGYSGNLVVFAHLTGIR